MLVANTSSPIQSAINASEKYVNSKLPATRREYDMEHNDPVDIAEMVRDAHRLGLINEELDKIADFS